MMSAKEISAMNIAFDFTKQYTVARVPERYIDAEWFALEVVYSLRLYVADKLKVDYGKVILIAISENDKVVVLCENNRYRDWLYGQFHQPSVGVAQFYNNVKPELILDRLDVLFP